MITNIQRKQTTFGYRVFSAFIAFTFIFTSLISPQRAQAQSVLNLPLPGAMIPMSPAYTPTIIAGMTIYPEDPLRFDFIIDVGDDHLEGEALRKESQKLISYFMATLTVPEDEMWVNLSPYEENRIIADGLGHTVMGRDMLAQDYILKQLTASLMYPEDELGSAFWQRIYAKAQAKFGTTQIPTNTFNKIWIVPQEAVIYANGTSIFVVDSHLKVMMEEDYLARQADTRFQMLDASESSYTQNLESSIQDQNSISSEIIREIIIPAIEKEVNEGKNFAPLRQIYHSMILATWYKKKLVGNGRDRSVLGKVYIDQNKTNGVDVEDKNIKHKIYNQYIEAFQKGVYDYIKEDYDEVTKQVIPRKYFSGGLGLKNLKRVSRTTDDADDIRVSSWLGQRSRSPVVVVETRSRLNSSAPFHLTDSRSGDGEQGDPDARSLILDTGIKNPASSIQNPVSSIQDQTLETSNNGARTSSPINNEMAFTKRDVQRAIELADMPTLRVLFTVLIDIGSELSPGVVDILRISSWRREVQSDADNRKRVDQFFNSIPGADEKSSIADVLRQFDVGDQIQYRLFGEIEDLRKVLIRIGDMGDLGSIPLLVEILNSDLRGFVDKVGYSVEVLIQEALRDIRDRSNPDEFQEIIESAHAHLKPIDDPLERRLNTYRIVQRLLTRQTKLIGVHTLQESLANETVIFERKKPKFDPVFDKPVLIAHLEPATIRDFLNFYRDIGRSKAMFEKFVEDGYERIYFPIFTQRLEGILMAIPKKFNIQPEESDLYKNYLAERREGYRTRSLQAPLIFEELSDEYMPKFFYIDLTKLLQGQEPVRGSQTDRPATETPGSVTTRIVGDESSASSPVGVSAVQVFSDEIIAESDQWQYLPEVLNEKYFAELAARIKKLRIAKEPNKRKAAQAIGISSQYLDRIENGHITRRTHSDTIVRIANFLEISVSPLFTEFLTDQPFDGYSKDFKSFFGPNVAKSYRAKGYTQQDFALEIGTDAPHLSRIQSGQVFPGLGLFIAIVRKLERSPDQLLRVEEVKKVEAFKQWIELSTNMKVSEHARSRRREKKLTQKDLAERAETSIPSIQNIENGERRVYLMAGTLQKLIDTLDTTILYLAEGKIPEKRYKVRDINNIGRNIQRLRDEQKLTKNQIGHANNISQVEDGRIMPSLQSLLSIARRLHVPPDLLLASAQEVEEYIDQYFSPVPASEQWKWLTDDVKFIGAWIRSHREQRGLSLEEVVERLKSLGIEISIDKLTKIESGELKVIPMNVIVGLADVFQMPMLTLLTGRLTEGEAQRRVDISYGWEVAERYWNVNIQRVMKEERLSKAMLARRLEVDEKQINQILSEEMNYENFMRLVKAIGSNIPVDDFLEPDANDLRKAIEKVYRKDHPDRRAAELWLIEKKSWEEIVADSEHERIGSTAFQKFLSRETRHNTTVFSRKMDAQGFMEHGSRKHLRDRIIARLKEEEVMTETGALNPLGKIKVGVRVHGPDGLGKVVGLTVAEPQLGVGVSVRLDRKGTVVYYGKNIHELQVELSDAEAQQFQSEFEAGNFTHLDRSVLYKPHSGDHVDSKRTGSLTIFKHRTRLVETKNESDLFQYRNFWIRISKIPDRPISDLTSEAELYREYGRGEGKIAPQFIALGTTRDGYGFIITEHFEGNVVSDFSRNLFNRESEKIYGFIDRLIAQMLFIDFSPHNIVLTDERSLAYDLRGAQRVPQLSRVELARRYREQYDSQREVWSRLDPKSKIRFYLEEIITGENLDDDASSPVEASATQVFSDKIIAESDQWRYLPEVLDEKYFAELAERIKKLRIDKEPNKTRAARAIGISLQQLSHIEKGNITGRTYFYTIVRIANFLEISVFTLLTGFLTDQSFDGYPKNFKSFFGTNVAKSYRAKGYTQQDFALELGLSVSHFYAIQSGQSSFNLGTFIMIARKLKRSPDQLLQPVEVIGKNDVIEEVEPHKQWVEFSLETKVGQHVRDLRKEKGLTQAQLAQRAGLYRTTISNIENDQEFYTRFMTLEKLIRGLGATIFSFATGKRPKKRYKESRAYNFGPNVKRLRKKQNLPSNLFGYDGYMKDVEEGQKMPIDKKFLSIARRLHVPPDLLLASAQEVEEYIDQYFSPVPASEQWKWLTDDVKFIGAWIRSHREQRGLALEEVAEQLKSLGIEISLDKLEKIESGELKVTPMNVIVGLADVFKIPVFTLLTGRATEGEAQRRVDIPYGWEVVERYWSTNIHRIIRENDVSTERLAWKLNVADGSISGLLNKKISLKNFVKLVRAIEPSTSIDDFLKQDSRELLAALEKVYHQESLELELTKLWLVEQRSWEEIEAMPQYKGQDIKRLREQILADLKGAGIMQDSGVLTPWKVLDEDDQGRMRPPTWDTFTLNSEDLQRLGERLVGLYDEGDGEITKGTVWGLIEGVIPQGIITDMDEDQKEAVIRRVAVLLEGSGRKVPLNILHSALSASSPLRLAGARSGEAVGDEDQGGLDPRSLMLDASIQHPGSRIQNPESSIQHQASRTSGESASVSSPVRPGKEGKVVMEWTDGSGKRQLRKKLMDELGRLSTRIIESHNSVFHGVSPKLPSDEELSSSTSESIDRLDQAFHQYREVWDSKLNELGKMFYSLVKFLEKDNFITWEPFDTNDLKKAFIGDIFYDTQMNNYVVVVDPHGHGFAGSPSGEYSSQILTVVTINAENSKGTLVANHLFVQGRFQKMAINVNSDRESSPSASSPVVKQDHEVLDPRSLMRDASIQHPGSRIQYQVSRTGANGANASSPIKTKGSTDSASSDYGGIDFNPNHVNLKEQGRAADMDFSRFSDIDPRRVTGITPVIINIRPLPSIFPLLGLKPKTREEEYKVSSLN